MSLQLFTHGVVNPGPGRGAAKPVLEGGQAGSRGSTRDCSVSLQEMTSQTHRAWLFQA